MENGPFIDDFPIKTSIYKGFSMAMLNYQRVIGLKHQLGWSSQSSHASEVWPREPDAVCGVASPILWENPFSANHKPSHAGAILLALSENREASIPMGYMIRYYYCPINQPTIVQPWTKQ